MVTKSKKPGARKGKKIKVLKLNKETVKDLTGDESKGVKGGIQYYYGSIYNYGTGSSLSAIGLSSRGQSTVGPSGASASGGTA